MTTSPTGSGPGRSPVTLADVAAAAGVSIATASRVINGSSVRRVRPELHDRVTAVAARLGYTVNAHAQAMARGSSAIIGLLVNDIADPYFSTIVGGVMRAAEQQGIVVLGSTRNHLAQELEYLATLRVQRAKAIILVGSRTTDAEHNARVAEELAAFRAGGGRVSVVSQDLLGTDTVLPDNRAGARALAAELIAVGHSRFAVLGGPHRVVAAVDRVAGFVEGVEAAGPGCSLQAVLPGEFTRDGGYRAAVQLLESVAGDSRQLPDCVFAVNDVMAVGAMAALRDHGVGVPWDVGVAGFDDIPTLRDVSPALTTVRLPLEEMGVRAGQMALLGEATPAPRVIPVPAQVVIRESTGRVAPPPPGSRGLPPRG